MYPISIGKVPIKAKEKPLIIDWSKENRFRIFFLGNRIFRVMIMGINVIE
jgi:hypothetical protein